MYEAQSGTKLARDELREAAAMAAQLQQQAIETLQLHHEREVDFEPRSCYIALLVAVPVYRH